MLVVKEAPEHGNQCVENGYSSVEWQLRYLGGWKLSKGVAEFDDGRVVVGGVLVREHAVVAGLLDLIFDRLGIFQVYCVGEYEVLGLLGRIGCQNKLSDVLFFTEPILDLFFLADADFL